MMNTHSETGSLQVWIELWFSPWRFVESWMSVWTPANALFSPPDSEAVRFSAGDALSVPDAIDNGQGAPIFA
jgi:hypothetical protein